jgi:hypothetical protein
MSRESSQRYNASYMDWEPDSNSQQGRQRSQSYHERQYLEPDPQESFSKVSIINEREYFKSDNRAAQASSSSSYETQHSEPQKGHFEDDYRASEVSKRQETSFSQQDNGPKLKTLIKQQEGVATKSYGEVTQESSFVAIKMNSDKFKGIVMCGVVKKYIDSYCGLIEVCKIGNQVQSNLEIQPFLPTWVLQKATEYRTVRYSNGWLFGIRSVRFSNGRDRTYLSGFFLARLDRFGTNKIFFMTLFFIKWSRLVKSGHECPVPQ